MQVKNRDKKSSLFWVVLGSVAVITALRTGVGTLTSPGPGLLPMIGGLLMIFLALIVFLQAFSREAKESEQKWVKIGNWRIWLVTACLCLYAFAFRRLGFSIATFLLLGFLFQLLDRKSWIRTGLTAAGVIFCVYLVFYVWLQVQLPRGFLGF
jgi:putative tricarboxylic transport membrane protein